MTVEEDKQFEDEVRRIARARWPGAAFAGATMLGGRERDGIFETDEVIHYVEATTSRRADKVKDDTKKLFSSITAQLRGGSMKGAIGWMVTREEPTADQRTEAREHGKQQVRSALSLNFNSQSSTSTHISLLETNIFLGAFLIQRLVA
jgi:hypothetical protein